MKKIIALLLVVVMAFSMVGCRIVIDGEETAAAQVKTDGSIGLAVSTQNNPFFVDLYEGAQAEADKLGVALKMADAGDDTAKQAADIEDLVNAGISVLVVNPVDSDAVTVCRRAKYCLLHLLSLPFVQHGKGLCIKLTDIIF